MAERDPQQELFTELLITLKALGLDVYDGVLPPDNTPYPFVYLADSTQNDEANKSAVFGNVDQTIHVWHNNPRQRGTVSDMLLKIKTACREIGHTANFSWHVRSITQNVMTDSTTKAPLLHGVLYVNFKFS